MRAARFVGSGQPLEITDVPDPVPGEGEVLVEVRGAGVNRGELISRPLLTRRNPNARPVRSEPE